MFGSIKFRTLVVLLVLGLSGYDDSDGGGDGTGSGSCFVVLVSIITIITIHVHPFLEVFFTSVLQRLSYIYLLTFGN